MEENIADALKMAGSVLLFVIGLSIAILYFSQAREAIDSVLTYSDRESLSIDGDPRFYYLANANANDTSRYVGIETIIPAIYRAYKENYKIVFEFPNDYFLFKQGDKKITTIDLEKQTMSSDLASRQFLDGIIYGKFNYDENKTIEDWKTKFDVNPNSISLYKYLTDNQSSYKIKESLGTYYREDVDADGDGHPDSEQYLEVDEENEDGTVSKVSKWVTTVEKTNRTKKRVITYKFEDN